MTSNDEPSSTRESVITEAEDWTSPGLVADNPAGAFDTIRRLVRYISSLDDDRFTLLNYQEAADLLGVNHQTTRALVKAGSLPLVEITGKAHRIRKSDVLAFIQRGGVRGNV